MNPQPRILVMGAGGIGGIVAATLTEAGSAVTAVTTNLAIHAAVDTACYRVTDEGEERVVRGWISAAPEGSYDLCILATQPPNVEDAALTALGHLADDARVVVLQNGLCEERLASIVGAERVIGAIVAWGASMPSPGRYERTAHGGFALGQLSGELDGDLRRVAELFEAIGPVTLTRNLRGDRLPQRGDRLARQAAPDRDADQRADRRDRVGDREGYPDVVARDPRQRMHRRRSPIAVGDRSIAPCPARSARRGSPTEHERDQRQRSRWRSHVVAIHP